MTLTVLLILFYTISIFLAYLYGQKIGYKKGVDYAEKKYQNLLFNIYDRLSDLADNGFRVLKPEVWKMPRTDTGVWLESRDGVYGGEQDKKMQDDDN